MNQNSNNDVTGTVLKITIVGCIVIYLLHRFLGWSLIWLMLCPIWFVMLLNPILKFLEKRKVKNRSVKKSATKIEARLYTLEQLDAMNGSMFEYAVADILRNNGYTNVDVTPTSGDYGADIIAYKEGFKYAIQCKRYSSTVGNHAVQEVYAAKAHYSCDRAMVITNNYFTKNAITQASSTGVILIDRNELYNMCKIGEGLVLVTEEEREKHRQRLHDWEVARKQEYHNDPSFKEEFGISWIFFHAREVIRTHATFQGFELNFIHEVELDDRIYYSAEYTADDCETSEEEAFDNVCRNAKEQLFREVLYEKQANVVTFAVVKRMEF